MNSIQQLRIEHRLKFYQRVGKSAFYIFFIGVLTFLTTSTLHSAPFKVNTDDAFNQYRSEVGIDSSGNFIISWSDDSNFDEPSQGTGSPTSRIYARRYNSSAVAQDGTEVSLKGPHPSDFDYSTSSIAMNGSGKYVVGISINPFFAGTDVYRQTGTFSGGLPGTEVTVYGGGGAQNAPSVAINDSGESVISYVLGSSSLYYTRYSSTDVAGSATFVATSTSIAGGNYWANDSAIAQNGNIINIWDNSGNLFGELRNSSDVVTKSAFQLNSSLGSAIRDPQVAMDDAGNFVVVWSATDGNILARRFDSAGTALGSDFQVNDLALSNNTNPDIAIDSNGNFIVTWEQFDGVSTDTVYARTFDSGGNATAGQFSIGTTTHDTRTNNLQNTARPKVALNDSNQYAITWTNFVDTTTFGNDIYADIGTASFVTFNTQDGVHDAGTPLDLGSGVEIEWQDITGDGDTVLSAGTPDSAIGDANWNFVTISGNDVFYDISSTASFTGTFDLTFDLTGAVIPFGFGTDDLFGIHDLGGGSFEILAGVYDGLNNTFTFSASSFSGFGVGVNPEPATLLLLGSALMGLFRFRKKLF